MLPSISSFQFGLVGENAPQPSQHLPHLYLGVWDSPQLRMVTMVCLRQAPWHRPSPQKFDWLSCPFHLKPAINWPSKSGCFKSVSRKVLFPATARHPSTNWHKRRNNILWSGVENSFLEGNTPQWKKRQTDGRISSTKEGDKPHKLRFTIRGTCCDLDWGKAANPYFHTKECHLFWSAVLCQQFKEASPGVAWGFTA